MQRRDAIALACGALAAVGLPNWAAARRPAPGSLLEFDERGIPYRASLDEDSPYFWECYDVRVTVDGRLPSACRGYDRRGGYVECVEVEPGREWAIPGKGFGTPIVSGSGETIPVRRYGSVVVEWAQYPRATTISTLPPSGPAPEGSVWLRVDKAEIQGRAFGPCAKADM